MQTNQKRCENCEYFLPHYVIHHGKLIKTFCGHCVNDNLSSVQRKSIVKYGRPCDEWKLSAETKKQNGDVLSALSDIEKAVFLIKQILNSQDAK